MSWHINLTREGINIQPEPIDEEMGLAGLEPSDTRTVSRGFLIELVGNLVIFIICTLVCLQVFAVAQGYLDDSRAISTLGQESLVIIEDWKAGDELPDIARRFGGDMSGSEMVIGYDRHCQRVSDLGQARYRIVMSSQAGPDGYSSGLLRLYSGDEVLLDWPIGRLSSPEGGRP